MQNLPQIVTHILQKAFFKRALVTEMEGFEPSHRYHRPAAFRVRSLQPLGYISKQQKLLSMKRRNLSSVLSVFSKMVIVSFLFTLRSNRNGFCRCFACGAAVCENEFPDMRWEFACLRIDKPCDLSGIDKNSGKKQTEYR